MKEKFTTDLSNVKIWDDLIDDRFLLDLDEESNSYSWGLGNIANRNSFPYKKKGSHLLWGVNFSLDSVPKNIISLYHFLINNVVKQQYKLNLIQINGQSLGQNGTVHVDTSFNTGERTLMVFINFKWQEKWGGKFQLLEEYNDNAKILKSIEYIPGRIILFDGNIPHRGLAPTEPYIVRKSLVYRLSPL